MSDKEFYKRIPSKISREAPVKITGQSLKGMKLTLKPVNREITDKTFNITNVNQ
jgi:hypothetical protein